MFDWNIGLLHRDGSSSALQPFLKKALLFWDTASWPLWASHRKPFFKLFFYALGFIPLLFSFAHLG